jgi:lipoprotein-anchoring transpeptidase ErfK/SrfK
MPTNRSSIASPSASPGSAGLASPGRRTKTRLRLAAALLGLVALAAPLGLAGCGTTASSSPAPATSVDSDSAATGTPSAADDHATHVARPTHAGVEVHVAPRTDSPVSSTLTLATPLGSPTTLLVLDHQHDGQGDWVQVALPSRPNGSQGWVEADEVTEQVDDVVVSVSLGQHVLRVTRDGELAVETPVAVGADATPTPVGQFYVTDVIDTGKPNGAYGPFALGLSAHSDVLDQFAGGDGQIGIHGTNEPTSIGTSASHGCVRVPNEVITALAGNIPLGTPVTITA